MGVGRVREFQWESFARDREEEYEGLRSRIHITRIQSQPPLIGQLPEPQQLQSKVKVNEHCLACRLTTDCQLALDCRHVAASFTETGCNWYG